MALNEPRLIRKYANRRLYDTVRSRYVNLTDVRNLIVEGHAVRIVEQSSGRDITNSILLMIIEGMERVDGALLTTEFLTNLIKAAGNSPDSGLAERLNTALRDALPRPTLSA